MSSIISGFVSKLSSAVKEQERSIITFLTVIIISTLNQVASKTFFKCPQKAHKEYGLCFLLGPAVMLAMITILISFGTDKSMAGICKKDKDVPELAKGGKRKRTWSFIIRKTFLTIGQSFVAFKCWIIITLITTDTYSCVKIGPMPKAKSSVANYLLEKERIDSHSKIAGLLLLVACLAIAMAMHFVVKCCFADQPKKSLPSMRRYDELEAMAANKVFAAHMTTTANINGAKIAHEALGVKDCQLECNEDDEDTPDSSPFLPAVKTERLEKVRKFLACRYPRIDTQGDTASPYLNPKVTWDIFRENCEMCDGQPKRSITRDCSMKDNQDGVQRACNGPRSRRMSAKGFVEENKENYELTECQTPDIAKAK